MASLSTCHLGLWLGWQILLNLVKQKAHVVTSRQSLCTGVLMNDLNQATSVMAVCAYCHSSQAHSDTHTHGHRHTVTHTPMATGTQLHTHPWPQAHSDTHAHTHTGTQARTHTQARTLYIKLPIEQTIIAWPM